MLSETLKRDMIVDRRVFFIISMILLMMLMLLPRRPPADALPLCRCFATFDASYAAAAYAFIRQHIAMLICHDAMPPPACHYFNGSSLAAITSTICSACCATRVQLIRCKRDLRTLPNVTVDALRVPLMLRCRAPRYGAMLRGAAIFSATFAVVRALRERVFRYGFS